MRNKKNTTRKGFTLSEFVTSCSTCMGKEGLLSNVAKGDKASPKPASK